MRLEIGISKLILHLMGNGWSHDVTTACFTKGAGRIADESLNDLLDWPGLIPFWKKAIAKGVIGWEIHTRKRPRDSGVRVDIDWEWPDVVTRLVEIT